jgi:hypothetical protein
VNVKTPQLIVLPTILLVPFGTHATGAALAITLINAAPARSPSPRIKFLVIIVSSSELSLWLFSQSNCFGYLASIGLSPYRVKEDSAAVD